MEYCDTTALERIERLKKRIRIIQGGTSAGKTIAILLLVLDLSFEVQNDVISIVSDTFPNLRRGALRDFQRILAGTSRDRFFEEIKTTHTFKNIFTGTIIEFFSTDDMGALGSRRDWLFINEANRISKGTFDQLEVRTKNAVWLDFNPVNEFWAHKLMEERNDTEFLKLTYLDNEGLDEAIIASIEARRDGDSNWWRVYGLGEVGSLDGNVYSGWKVLDKIPDDYKLAIVGGDWGFANDPTAVVGIYVNEDKDIIYDEWFYAAKVKDEDVGRIVMADHPEAASVMAVLDGANPQGIMRWRELGWQSFAASKPAGSVIAGVNYIRQKNVSYTSHSKNLEKEYLTYAFVISKSTGESTGVPIDKDNHLMDALRYGTSALANMRKL